MSKRYLGVLLVVFLAGGMPYHTADAASFALGDELFKLTASDAASGDRFGESVAISGNTAIVGSHRDDDAGGSSGSAFLFDATTGSQLFKLTASDAAGSDQFGLSVGISGNAAIVGAKGNGDAGGFSGSAYLFDVATGNQLHKLTASDAEASDVFGISVAISGNRAIVGATGDDDDGSNSGSAYLFDVATGNQLFKLTASDAASGDEFGGSVAISGNVAIVGAYLNDDAGNGSGSAYIFDVTTGNQLFKLTASDAISGAHFGTSVAISGTRAVVGAGTDNDVAFTAGSAYIFDVTTGNQLFKLTASDAAAGDLFGTSVAINGSKAIVGALADDDAGDGSGSAYLFDAATGNQLYKLTASDAVAGAFFGVSVAISADVAIVGADERQALSNSGSAYLFDAAEAPVPVRIASLTAERTDHGAQVIWEVVDAADHLGFHVFRDSPSGERVQLTTDLLFGHSRYEFTDPIPPAGRADYWLAEISRTGETAWHGPAALQDVRVTPIAILAAHPNPFRSTTSISFSLEQPGHVRVTVLDVQGRRVRTLLDGTQPAGNRTVHWNGAADGGAPLSGGVYFVRVRIRDSIRTQKVVLSR